MAITSWCILALGLLIDLYFVVLVIVKAAKGKVSSTVPIAGAFFYLLYALLRKSARLDPHWTLVVILVLLHFVWHLVLVPRLAFLNRPG